MNIRNDIIAVKVLRIPYKNISLLCRFWQCTFASIDWLVDYLLFYVPLKNCSLIWRRHHYWWRAAKCRPLLGSQSLWAGRYLYRATPAVTRDLGFSGLIRGTAPFSRLLRPTRGCGWSILTLILTGPFPSNSLHYLRIHYQIENIEGH
jgi:hypothetical protein